MAFLPSNVSGAFNSLPSVRQLPPPGSSAVMTWVDTLGSQGSPLAAGSATIDGLAFDYTGEIKVESTSDITDHYMEDNTPSQDHIAIAPRRVTLKGLVGELVAGPGPSGVLGVLNNIQDALTLVPGFIPIKTPTAILKANKAISSAQKLASQVSTAVGRGKSLWKMFSKGDIADTKQAQMYQRLEKIQFNTSILIAVTTPFCYYPAMAIESIMALQPEDTKFLSEFTVTLKEVRYAAILETQMSGAPNFVLASSGNQNHGRLYGSVQDVSGLGSMVNK